MLNGECEVAWFWLLHAILLTIFAASLVLYRKLGDLGNNMEISSSSPSPDRYHGTVASYSDT